MADHHSLQQELSALDPNLTEDDLLQDPALAMCCMEEVVNQRKAAALKQKLLAQDRSEQRQKLMAKVVLQPYANSQVHASKKGPAEHHQNCHAGCQAVDSLSGDAHEAEGEEDELRDLRMRRLQQMQQEVAAKQQRAKAGFGQLHTVEGEQQLLDEVEAQQGLCVCHLAVSGYQPCDECDQQLEVLAHQWQGTWFARCCTSRKSMLRTRLNLDALPAIVCFKDGALIGKAPLHMFGAAVGDILEEELIGYLKRLGVLRRPSSTPALQQAATQDSDASEDDDEEQQQSSSGLLPPCELCGRRYPHEHVKAVYGEQPDTDSSDDL